MTKIFKFKKSSFWLIFGPFFQYLGQKNFSGKLALSSTTPSKFVARCQNLEKTNDTIPRKCPGRQKDRWKDGQKNRWILLYKTIPATPREPKIIFPALVRVLSRTLHPSRVFGNPCSREAGCRSVEEHLRNID